MGAKIKYFFSHHQHKAKPLELALRKTGHYPVYRRADIAFFDHDAGRIEAGTPRKKLVSCYEEGSAIVIYPHSALPNWWNDGIKKLDQRVHCMLTIGEGQRQIMKMIEPQCDYYVTGWYYCPQKPFVKPESYRRILFAPIHPSANGQLRRNAKEANQRAMKALEKIVGRNQVLIRHIGSLEDNGLWHNSKMYYNNGKPDGSFKEIDWADVVIAEGTFMYIAAARGKPVIGLNQRVPTTTNKTEKAPKNWDKYGDLLAYPIDLDDGPLIELMEKAMKEEQVEWKKLFIGKDLERFGFSSLCKSIIGRYKQSKVNVVEKIMAM